MTPESTTDVKKKLHSSPPPLLPKRDEGTLLEIMRNMSADIRSLCDAVNQLNSEIEAKDGPDAQDQAMMKALLKQMTVMMDQVMGINTFLIEQQAMNYKDILRWALQIATAALAVACGIKLYMG